MEIVVHHAPSLGDLPLNTLQGLHLGVEVEKEYLASETLGVLGEVQLTFASPSPSPSPSGSRGWGFKVTWIIDGNETR